MHWPTYYRPHLETAADLLVALDQAPDAQEQLQALTSGARERLLSGVQVRLASSPVLTRQLRNQIVDRLDEFEALYEVEHAELVLEDERDRDQPLQTFKAKCVACGSDWCSASKHHRQTRRSRSRSRRFRGRRGPALRRLPVRFLLCVGRLRQQRGRQR